VRQPFARVGYVPQSEIKNLATVLVARNTPNQPSSEDLIVAAIYVLKLLSSGAVSSGKPWILLRGPRGVLKGMLKH
jgi:hypothetical protein